MVAGEIAGGSRLAIDSATSSVSAAPRYGAHTCAGFEGQVLGFRRRPKEAGLGYTSGSGCMVQV